MNYELAAELRDAGFPQFFSEGMAYYDKQGLFVESACSEYNHDQDWSIRVPTLEELIEACGADYFTLSGIGNDWLAKYGAHPSYEARGKTKDEAVARLWLALQKSVVK